MVQKANLPPLPFEPPTDLMNLPSRARVNAGKSKGLVAVSPPGLNGRTVISGTAEAIGRVAAGMSDTDTLNKATSIAVMSIEINQMLHPTAPGPADTKFGRQMISVTAFTEAVQFPGDIAYFCSQEIIADAKAPNGASVIMSRIAFFISNIAAAILFIKDIAVSLLGKIFSPFVSSTIGYVAGAAGAVGYTMSAVDAIQRLSDKRLQTEAKEYGLEKQFTAKAALDLAGSIAGIAACVAAIAITALGVGSGVGLPVLLALGVFSASMGIAKFAYGQHYDNKLSAAKMARGVQPEDYFSENKHLRGLQKFTEGVAAVTRNSDALKQFSKLLRALADTTEVIKGSTEGLDDLRRAAQVAGDYAAFSTGFGGSVARIAEFFAIGENGKRFWEEPGAELKIANRVTLVAANAIETALWIEKLGANLGAATSTKVGVEGAGVPALVLAKDCAVVTASLFGIGDNASKLQKSAAGYRKEQDELQKWKQVSDNIGACKDEFKQILNDVRVNGVEKRTAKGVERVPLSVRDVVSLTNILHRNDTRELKELADDQIGVWTKKVENTQGARGKNIIGIVNEVAKISIVTMASVGSALGLMGLLPFSAAMLAVAIAAALIQIIKVVYDAVVKKQAIRGIELKVSPEADTAAATAAAAA